ncbi:MAG: hypothetical protein AAF367_03450 [Pseudomonadota bacterium]
MHAESFFRVAEVDLFALGLVFFSTGFPILNLILGSMPLIFIASMQTLQGEGWRRRTNTWLGEGRWINAYAGLLQTTLGVARMYFGLRWSTKSLERCARLALIYGTIFMLLSGIATRAGPDAGDMASFFVVIASFGFLGYYALKRTDAELSIAYIDPPNWARGLPDRAARWLSYCLWAVALAFARELIVSFWGDDYIS